MKTCIECNKDFPEENFHPKKTLKSGEIYRYPRCKECHNTKEREKQKTHRKSRDQPKVKVDRFILAGITCF